MTRIAGAAEVPWNQATHRRIRHQFQSSLAEALRQEAGYNPQNRMRQKLRRWQMPGLPRIISDRANRRLVKLRDLAPPRVCAAMLSTLWNRWTTKRRFQQRGRCVLLCSETASDCIEHYANCPVVRRSALRHLNLRLRPWPHALVDFMGLSGPPTANHPSDAALARTALLVYATYIVTNAARHKSPADMTEAMDMMKQAIWEGARGHEKCTRSLHGAFPAHP